MLMILSLFLSFIRYKSNNVKVNNIIIFDRAKMFEKNLVLKNYEGRAVWNKEKGVPIIFLHGYSFTIEVWEKIGVLQFLRENKIPFLAIDMPYGKKSLGSPKTRKPEFNIGILKDAIESIFGSEIPVLVGASLGGYISLRYSVNYSVKGMLLVAPTRGLSDDLVKGYSDLEIPISILYGTRDRVVSLKEMKKLVDVLPKAMLIVYKNANHPAYLDNPNDFKKHLMDLYRNFQDPCLRNK
jgi:pimeloyl-ACP methyl ester carboxylesterase